MIRSEVSTTKLSGTRIEGRAVIASTGTNALDTIMGGGAPSSSLIVIDEVETRKFFSPLARCFLAEGITAGQTVFFASSSAAEAEWLYNLPSINESGEPSLGKRVDNNDPDFQIAWRYNTLPKIESSVQAAKSAIRSKFDLSKKLAVDVESLKLAGQLIEFQFSSFLTFAELWEKLKSLLCKDEFLVEGRGPKKFLRILVSSLTSVLWRDSENFVSFLIHLKTFCRSANSLVMLSIDSLLIPVAQYNSALRLADAFIRLEYVSKEEQKLMNLHQNFDGRLYILKLPTIVSAASHQPDCLDLIFLLKRTYFDVKIFHLPPAIGSEETSKHSKPSCQQTHEKF